MSADGRLIIREEEEEESPVKVEEEEDMKGRCLASLTLGTVSVCLFAVRPSCIT